MNLTDELRLLRAELPNLHAANMKIWTEEKKKPEKHASTPIKGKEKE